MRDGRTQPPHFQLVHYALPILLLMMHQLASCTTSVGTVIDHVDCIDVERQALFDLKQGLTDTSGRLSSWQGEDCCKWIGVHCDNMTGHVFKLDLQNYNSSASWYSIGGEIRPSLLHLKHLHYLDLSYNDFNGINIPKFIGTLKHLSCFGNDGNSLVANSLHWLSGLPSLTYLSMNYVNLTMAANDWLHHVNMLPALQELRLRDCVLHNLPYSLSSVNFTSLLVLELSDNNFNASIPQWLKNLHRLSTLRLVNASVKGYIPSALGNLTSLQYLDLSSNHINGKISRSLGNLCNMTELLLSDNSITGVTEFLDELSKCRNSSLERLNLMENQITGILPSSIGNLKNLKSLVVLNNHMNGTIPRGIGELSQLFYLDLSSNFFEGVVSESHFANLAKLEVLDLSSTSKKSLILQVSSNWIPAFTNLGILDLSNWQVGPFFPSWLRAQENIYTVTLRNTGISDNLPEWFGELSKIHALDLSFNQIKGGLQSFLPQLPNMRTLFLGGNMLSGSIPSNIGRLMPNLVQLDLSMNLINGRIPLSISELTQLEFIVLSDNGLTGELPQWCWKDVPYLAYVDFSYNHLMGKIPSSLLSLESLECLKLANNKFYGELPPSFQNHSKLICLDLGENNLSGEVPAWQEKGFPRLKILRLHSNLFTGRVPSQLCSLSSLQVLDLGKNELSGQVPQCFGNFSAMAVVHNDNDTENNGLSWGGVYNSYSFDVTMTVSKGRELNFSSNLRLLKSIDLSNNNLTGDIPQELTILVGLNILNLSQNHLHGMIPEKIGKLAQLESLDLSHNQLSGPIPPSIASLNFLSHLNLSYNNLKGRIPSGNQLNTLYNSSIYEGNPELCGPPLANKCEGYEPTEGEPSTPRNEDEHNEVGTTSFYVSMGVGFIVGFLGVFGILVLKDSWRHSCFQLIDAINNQIYGFITRR
ncbi:hypothetical protein Sjap_015333 [Stephania japonica]|uniref:Leucine-rich repeat-containing N-terminal plant-type domain-containing protein n=1 Tax=Stephania japonica TaxID=461633 RepID=A0AAP0IKH7_9MAGN